MQCMPVEEAFLGLEKEDEVSYADAKLVIIPFGLEASVSYGGGTAQGPAAMIKASHEVELFDEQLWCEPYKKFSAVTLVEPKIDEDIETALKQLETTVRQVLQDGKFPMIFGGEHSITAGSIRPFAEKYPDLVMLHFDAHADLRDGYEGVHYSHASALRRCMDFEHIKLVSVGIRNISSGEVPFLDANKHRIHIYWSKDQKTWDLDEMMGYLAGRPIYLTFDVDGFDASLMPATGTPEPGGLFWQEVIEVITRASQVGKIVGADINELAPKENLHACDFLAAKLAYKILALAFK